MNFFIKKHNKPIDIVGEWCYSCTIEQRKESQAMTYRNRMRQLNMTMCCRMLTSRAGYVAGARDGQCARMRRT